jgi:hypothetical protein
LQEIAEKEKNGELRKVEPEIRERSMQWRHVITSDPEYAYHKKMLFQVRDPFRSTSEVNKTSEFQRNKDPWVQKLIMS